MNNFNHIFNTREDGAFVVKVPIIRVYIPEAYIDHKIAEISGDDVDLLPLFNFDVYGEDIKSFDEENPLKKPVRYFMKIPTMMRMSPSDIIQERDDDKKVITILEFYEGDLFFQTVDVMKNWKIVNNVVTLLIKGFIPKEIPYNEITDFINECCILNKVNLEINDTILDLVVAELSRNPNDLNQSFRHFLRDSKSAVSMKNKKMIAMERLGRINNTFAAVGSGDPKFGISTSIIRSKTGGKEKSSSIEEVLSDV
jgi:hypothetical protein